MAILRSSRRPADGIYRNLQRLRPDNPILASAGLGDEAILYLAAFRQDMVDLNTLVAVEPIYVAMSSGQHWVRSGFELVALYRLRNVRSRRAREVED